MMVRPTIVPRAAKLVVPAAAPHACGRWKKTAELTRPSTTAMRSSGIAASVKPTAKWMAEASAKVAASAAIAAPVLRLGARRLWGARPRPFRPAWGAGVMVAPAGVLAAGPCGASLRRQGLHHVQACRPAGWAQPGQDSGGGASGEEDQQLDGGRGEGRERGARRRLDHGPAQERAK